jgi:hypothetical protein
LRKYGEKGFPKTERPYIIYVIAAASAFLLSFFPAKRLYEPAAVCIIFLLLGGVLLSAEKLIKIKPERKTISDFEGLQTGLQDADAGVNTENNIQNRDSDFEDLYASLCIRAENAGSKGLQALALSVSEEREKPGRTKLQKEKLNRMLNSIIKKLADNDF